MMWSIVECCQLLWYPTFTSLEPSSDFSCCRSFCVNSDSHCHDRDAPRTPATNLPAFCPQDFSNTMEASAWTIRGINATKGNSQPMKESRQWISAPEFIVQMEAFCMLLRGSRITELLLPSVATSSMRGYIDFSFFPVPSPFFFFLLSSQINDLHWILSQLLFLGELKTKQWTGLWEQKRATWDWNKISKWSLNWMYGQ